MATNLLNGVSEKLICLNVNGSFGLDIAETPDYPCLDAFLRDMDRLGIVQAIVWNKAAVPHAPSGNRKLVEILRASPAAQARSWKMKMFFWNGRAAFAVAANGRKPSK